MRWQRALRRSETPAQPVDEFRQRDRVRTPTGVCTALFFRQAFMTAAQAFHAIDSAAGRHRSFGPDGKQLMLRDLCAAYGVELEIDLLRRAQQYSVNVFPHVLKKLMASASLCTRSNRTPASFCLNERYYGELFGLATEPVSSMEVLYAP